MPSKLGRPEKGKFAMPDRLLILLYEMGATISQYEEKYKPTKSEEVVLAPIEWSTPGLSGILFTDKKGISSAIKQLAKKEKGECIRFSKSNHTLIPGNNEKQNLSRPSMQILYLTEFGEERAKEKLEILKGSKVKIVENEDMVNEFNLVDLLDYIKEDLGGQDRFFFYSLLGEFIQDSSFTFNDIHERIPFKLDVQYKILIDGNNDVLFKEYIVKKIPEMNSIYNKVRKMQGSTSITPVLARQYFIVEKFEKSFNGKESVKEASNDDFTDEDEIENFDMESERKKTEMEGLLKHITEERYSFIIGESGSGKSTLLTLLSNEFISNHKRPRYPINLDFSRYNGQPIINWIKSELGGGVNRIEIEYGLEKAIEEKRIIIMVDGLDENPAMVSTFFKEIDLFIRSHPETKFVFTSRYEQVPVERCNIISISSLSIENRNTFIRESIMDDNQSERIISELDNDKNIEELTRNPMLLNILCVLLLNDYTLPRGKHQLFRDVIGAFIEWGKARVSGLSTDENELLEIYSCIAYTTMKSEKSSFHAEDLEIEDVLPGVNIAEYLDSSTSSDSIIVKKAGGYQFFHKSFQEFLASKWIGVYDIIEETVNTANENIGWWLPVLEFYSSGTNSTNIIKKINGYWKEDIFFSKLKIMSLLAIEGRRCELNFLKKLYENLIIYSISSHTIREEKLHFRESRLGIGNDTFPSLIDKIALKIDDYEFLKSKYESLIPEEFANEMNDETIYTFPRLFQYFELLKFNEPIMDGILPYLNEINSYISRFQQEEWRWGILNFIERLFNGLISDAIEKRSLYYSICLEIIKDYKDIITKIQDNLIQGLLRTRLEYVLNESKHILLIFKLIIRLNGILQGDEEDQDQSYSKEFLKWMRTVIYLDGLDEELKRMLFNILMDDLKIIEDFSPDGFISSKPGIDRGSYFLSRIIWELENETTPQSCWERITGLASPFYFPYKTDTELEFIGSICDSLNRLMDDEKDTVIRNGLIGLINKFSLTETESFTRLMDIYDKYKNDPNWIKNIDTVISKEEVGTHFGHLTRYVPVHSPSITFISSILLRYKREKEFDEQIKFALNLLEAGSRGEAQVAFDFVMDFSDQEKKLEALYWLFRSAHPFQIYINADGGFPQIDPRIFRHVFTIILDMEDYENLCMELLPHYGEDEKIKNGLNKVLIMYPGLADERVMFDSMEFDEDGHFAHVILNYIVTVITRNLIDPHKDTVDKIKEYLLNVFNLYINKPQRTIFRRNEVLTNLLFALSIFNIKVPFRDIIKIISELDTTREDHLSIFLRSYDIDDWNELKEMINESLRSPNQDMALYHHYLELINIYRNINKNIYGKWKYEFHENIIEMCKSAEEAPFLIWHLRDFFDREDLPVLTELFMEEKDHPMSPYLRTLIFELSSIDDLNTYIIPNLKEYIPIAFDYYMGHLEIGRISDNMKYNLLYNTIWDSFPEERSKLIGHKFSSEHFIRLINEDPDGSITLDGLRSLSKACHNIIIDHVEVKIFRSEHIVKIRDYIGIIFYTSEDPLILADCLVIIKVLDSAELTRYFKQYNDMILFLSKDKKIDMRNDRFINPEKMTTISYPFFIFDQIAEGNLEFVDYIMEYIELKMFTKSKEYISTDDDPYHRIGTSICRGAGTPAEIMDIITRYPMLFGSIRDEIGYLFRGTGYFTRVGMGLPEILYDLS